MEIIYYKIIRKHHFSKQFENKLSNLSLSKLKNDIVTLTLILREVHLVQTPRELALLDLLREIGVTEPLGEFDAAIVAARLGCP